MDDLPVTPVGYTSYKKFSSINDYCPGQGLGVIENIG